ncbi:MFS transporter [Nonomuraea sp. NPDC046570]|uniref:MFS transporter n=1 Tax=Nonomuraea sp. NPDC046570 TaxID=3155255 RepID=UPI0033E96FD1
MRPLSVDISEREDQAPDAVSSRVSWLTPAPDQHALPPVATARLSSTLGTTVAPLGLAFAVLQAGGGAAALGLVLTAGMLILIVVTPVAGVLADRVPRMTIIIVCQLTCALTQLIAAGLVMTGMARTWSLAVLAAVTGAVSACFQPVVKGVVPQLVDSDDLVPANALLQIGNNAIAISTPAAAGAIIAASGPGWILLWDGVTFLASAAVFATLRLPPAGGLERHRFTTDFVEGWRAFTGLRWLWCLTLLGMITSACWAAGITVLGPVYATEQMQGAVSWGLVSSAIGVGPACGSLASLLHAPTRIGLLVCCAAIPEAVFLASMSFNAALPVIAMAGAFTGAAGTLQLINWTAYLQRVVPEAQLSRVLATTATIGTLLTPIFYAAAGPVAQATSTRVVLGVCTIAVMNRPSKRTHRHRSPRVRARRPQPSKNEVHEECSRPASR